MNLKDIKNSKITQLILIIVLIIFYNVTVFRVAQNIANEGVNHPEIYHRLGYNEAKETIEKLDSTIVTDKELKEKLPNIEGRLVAVLIETTEQGGNIIEIEGKRYKNYNAQIKDISEGKVEYKLLNGEVKTELEGMYNQIEGKIYKSELIKTGKGETRLVTAIKLDETEGVE